MRRSWLLLALAVAFALAIGSAQATPGQLDASFGGTGMVTTAFGTSSAGAAALVRQADGKLVAAGYSFPGSPSVFALARYNADGSLDTSFNGTGKATTAIGTSGDFANALVVQPDGKLVAAGSSATGSQGSFALARYNPDGSLDTSFNGTGMVTTAFGTSGGAAHALVLQPDGKLVAAGWSHTGSQNVFALARYNPDGSLDTSFNGTGKVMTAFGTSDDEVGALVLQPDGKLVAAGWSHTGSQNVFALARYNPDGSLDTSFNGTGKVTTAFGTSGDFADALVLQPDGKLVAAGFSGTGSQNVFALARYNADGSLDTSFNSTGKLTTAFGTSDDGARALVLQPDGKLVAAGWSYTGSRYVFALARFIPNGSLDTSFHGTGKLTTDFFADSAAWAVVLQPDGRLVAAGNLSGSQGRFALARYLGSTLSVGKAGTGAGTVTSSPAGISCGSTCSAPFGTVSVTLTASPAAGSTFTGWSGSPCTGTGTCTLTMSTDHAVTGTFQADKTLTVTRSGTGTGTITSTPAGISCGAACSHSYRYGTAVTLTATPAAGSNFAGWSGACTGTGTCSITTNANTTATATFRLAPAPKPCLVPKVNGRTLKKAKRSIRAHACTVGKVKRASSRTVKKGHVISQKPKPGKRLKSGAKVNLVVSKGRP